MHLFQKQMPCPKSNADVVTIKALSKISWDLIGPDLEMDILWESDMVYHVTYIIYKYVCI